MCFMINPQAKRPRQRKAYKVARLHNNGVVTSPVMNAYKWHTGEHRIAKTARTESEYIRGNQFAAAGFYVLHNKADAIKERDKWNKSHANVFGDNPFVVLELEVEPKDWLHSNDPVIDISNRGLVSTYRKVTVPEKQPDIEWY